MESTALLKLL